MSASWGCKSPCKSILYSSVIFYFCGNRHVIEFRINGWGCCSATCPFRERQSLKQFGVKWWNPSLWPSATGLSSILCSLDRNRGRLWWPNVETETQLLSNWAVHPCLVIDGQSGRCGRKEVVHLKLSLLIFAVWQPVWIPKVMLHKRTRTNPPTHRTILMHVQIHT